MKLNLAMFLPNGVAFLSEARISVKRIQDFMLLSELKSFKDDMEVSSNGSVGPEETSGPSLQFEHVVCHWSDSAMEDTLFDVSLLTRLAIKIHGYRGVCRFCCRSTSKLTSPKLLL